MQCSDWDWQQTASISAGKTHDSPKLPRIGGGQLKREPAGKQMPVPGPGMYSHHDNTKLPAYRYNGPSLFESCA